MIAYYVFLIVISLCAIAYRFAHSAAPSDSLVSRISFPNTTYILHYAGGFAVIMLLIHSLFWQRFIIPSKSMLPTLLVGQTITVSPSHFGVVNPFTLNKLYNFDNQPEYGQIVLARFPYSSDVQYVKRVVALPGDTISIQRTGITINKTYHPFIPIDKYEDAGPTHTISLGEIQYGVIIDVEKQVQEVSNYKLQSDEVFLLGDNLTGSVDSRELGGFKLNNLLALVRN